MRDPTAGEIEAYIGMGQRLEAELGLTSEVSILNLFSPARSSLDNSETRSSQPTSVALTFQKLRNTEDVEKRDNLIEGLLGATFYQRTTSGLPFLPSTDAFTFTACLLDIFTTDAITALTLDPPSSIQGPTVLQVLSFEKRNDIKLQSLVLFTLIQRNAAKDLVALANPCSEEAERDCGRGQEDNGSC
ncbi:hypothetical protein P7C70_g4296, partial [Phenoliferia sp. Uapishka_3]